MSGPYTDRQKEQLKACAQKLSEFAELIEPLFKVGHTGFAPNTDWWCIIAGLRHCSIADTRMLLDFANQLDREATEYPPYLKAQMMSQRKRHVAESEIESPCGNGCMMTWRNQYTESPPPVVAL